MLTSFADLHIHIGYSLDGKPVKITAAKTMTLPQVIKTARDVKGLSLIGIIDSQSPGVQRDFLTLEESGLIKPLAGGGYDAQGLTVLCGTEVELTLGTGSAHLLAYFPDLEHLQKYREKLEPYIKNWQLSSQKAHIHVATWLEAVKAGEGIWFPAHAFTPHKGIYGNCCSRLLDVLPEFPLAIEMGLSADRQMARSISELDGLVLFSNSDAHSLPNIAREYNLLEISENSFLGLRNLLLQKEGRVVANYGLPPPVGKYHRTYCLVCEKVVEAPPPFLHCPTCGSSQVIRGVLDRLLSIADGQVANEPDPMYVYQVPLRNLPGVGPKLIQRLLDEFGTELNILHHVSVEDLNRVAGEKIASLILSSRQGKCVIKSGGGGIYGKVLDILS